jgi:hypothetical protein
LKTGEEEIYYNVENGKIDVLAKRFIERGTKNKRGISLIVPERSEGFGMCF